MEIFYSNERALGHGSDPHLALLEQSLEVSYLRSGSYSNNGWLGWTVRPFTLLTQPCLAHQFQVDGEEPMTVPAGHGCIMPEGLRFRGMGYDLPGDQLAHWGHFRFRILGELDLFHLVRSPFVVNAEVAGRMTDLNQRLAALVEDSTAPMMLRVLERRRHCTEMLALILSVCEPRPGAMQSVTSVARIVPVLRFMREQMARPIFLEEMAQVVSLSPTRFNVVFRQATRQSPLQYLTELRVKRAQELLLSTQQPVNEIGEAVGFRDAFHFSKTFKRFSGAGPREYRLRGKMVMADDR